MSDPVCNKKVCNRCRGVFDKSNFYRRTKSPDGLEFYCKSCCNEAASKWAKKNPDKRRVIAKRFDESPKGRAHREREKAKQQALPPKSRWLAQKTYRFSDPIKYRAWTAVGNAIASGRLVKQSCEVCGSSKTHAHHEDYSKPLDVRWLCRMHHEALHHQPSDVGVIQYGSSAL